MTEIRLYVWIRFPPLIPSLRSLLEDVKMFLVCHLLPSLGYRFANSFAFCSAGVMTFS